MALINGSSFTTKDNDHDGKPTGNCAVECGGAWWYHQCSRANLNGKYRTDNGDSNDSMSWKYFFANRKQTADSICKNCPPLTTSKFFYNCKLFGMRGHDEHHALECDQFIIGEDSKGKYFVFVGRASKTFKGGLAQREIDIKNIIHYSNQGERCIVDLYELKYLQVLVSGKFYRRALPGTPPRFGNQPEGVNKLRNLMKIICARAGLSGNYTNHSGKRTCATQLYIAGVDEQEIMKRTGHMSEKAVRKYKSADESVLRKVSSVLDPPQKRKCPENKTHQEEPTAKRATVPLSDISNLPTGSLFNNCQVTFNVGNK
ncbi:LOW QUALITY PROTEIN: uncharacterized protein LOC117343738 [Pecten maximus]|uniref:LOW QUALITY PROTEIN: uncharacterized protein LOC117343738 n=1 Tax=Pecten maximus TaxID=6579 RepID=UPI0014581277|nr:LOW QUALITY PROTEIN: uncharacterized protein LOC117343738 [Pecten maximus]